MKLQRTLLITGVLILLDPFLGFPSFVDRIILVILAAIVIAIAFINRPDYANGEYNNESVFSEHKPGVEEEVEEVVEQEVIEKPISVEEVVEGVEIKETVTTDNSDEKETTTE